MNEIQKVDLIFGENKEEQIHEYLESFYGELKRTKDNPEMGYYYEFDKYNDNHFLEIKGRRIYHNQYPTLMFGYNKYLKGKKLLEDDPDLNIIYLWNCKDGIYYWKHDSSRFTIQTSGRHDRGKPELSKCLHVETKYIHRLE